MFCFFVLFVCLFACSFLTSLMFSMQEIWEEYHFHRFQHAVIALTANCSNVHNLKMSFDNLCLDQEENDIVLQNQ